MSETTEDKRPNRRRADMHARAKAERLGFLQTAHRTIARVSPHAITPIRHSIARDAMGYLRPVPSHDWSFRKGWAALLGVSVYTLRHWIAGRRAMTKEARAVLIEMMDAHLARGHAIRDALATMPTATGHSIHRVRAGKARAVRERDKAANQP